MTAKEMAALNQYMDAIEETVLALKKKVDGFGVRLDELEGSSRSPAPAERTAAALAELYRGTWSPDQTYTRGHLCTDRGSLWLAVTEPGGRPGQGDSGWRLVAKRGRDGRDRPGDATR